MIRIEHLRKEYPTAVPLKDVNVEIHNHCTHEHLQEDRANEVGKNQCINELSDVIKCYIGNNQEGDGLQ